MNSSMSSSEPSEPSQPSRKLLSSPALKLKFSSLHNYQIAMVRTKSNLLQEMEFMVVDGRHLPVKNFENPTILVLTSTVHREQRWRSFYYEAKLVFFICADFSFLICMIT